MKKKFISEKERLTIVIICYANVTGTFATYLNKEYRNENFSWKNSSFATSKSYDIAVVARGYDDNWFVKEYKGATPITVEEYVLKISNEIYETLLKKSGLT